MPLSVVDPGRKVRLATVNAGRGLRPRLAAMRLSPGAEIEVINRC
ncbi:MAG: ferrous iron transport protein A, partial [Candidatus Zixiibacteriota bacterium]